MMSAGETVFVDGRRTGVAVGVAMGGGKTWRWAARCVASRCCEVGMVAATLAPL